MNAHLLAALLALACATQTLAQAQPEIVAETPKNQAPVDTTPIKETPITAADRAHWAFAPVVRLPLPQVTKREWQRTAVDAFILTKLEKAGLTPAAEAGRATLLRRLSFDLIGLPPTPEELAAFEADRSPDAYERQVDRLLASPAFGERYGQYWLDLARFAETDGYEHDKVRSNAWKYRDWVIAALNADLPYDEFVREQLDGDELAGFKFKVPGSKSVQSTLNFEPASLNSAAAAMFCLSGPDMPDINDQLERRHSLMNELTATVGAAFLGLQLGCAQCHDHKYDPLSQGDFYRLRAVFEPAVPALKRDVPVSTLALQKTAEPARLWVRGDYRRPGVEVQPAFPRIASTPARSASDGATSIRSELADWLMRADNPLTSRVIANRLWQGHFGRGLCSTPSDFGLMGGGVTHTELLDWLAVELRESGWGLKGLHRRMVESATYRQAGRNSELRMQNAEEASELYASYPRRRLEGEAIRDAMLAAAGLLTSERSGPGVMPPLPQELLETLLKGQWTASKREADHYKRSVYVFARRNLRYPIFEAFDRPDGNASCPIRNKSTTAPQSLQLFNSEFSLLAARHLAGRILNNEEPKNRRTEDRVRRLYQFAFSRQPSATEAATLVKFLAEQQERLKAERRPARELALPIPIADSTDIDASAALVDACLAVLNASEFIYVD